MNAIEAEVVEQSQALVKAGERTPTLFGTSEPAGVIERAAATATALKAVIQSQGLISNISGKQYPKCEAWTLLGTMLGIFPVLEWTRKVEGGWEARVEARTRDGAVVGAAEAQCLKAEKNWANRDDFAIRSMAQTRATAKALRMPLGFVMTLAGYEATPAEEMGDTGPRTRQEQKGVSTPPPANKNAPQSQPEAKASALVASEKTKAWFLDQLKDCRDLAKEYLEKVGWLLPTEALEDLELRFVPVSKEELSMFRTRMAEFGNGEQADKPYGPHLGEGAENLPHFSAPEPWRTFPMPWGKQSGTPLGDLDKKYLFGLWANYVVETEYNGKPKKPEAIAKDKEFRAMLDQAGAHYGFTRKEDKPDHNTDVSSDYYGDDTPF